MDSECRENEQFHLIVHHVRGTGRYRYSSVDHPLNRTTFDYRSAAALRVEKRI